MKHDEEGVDDDKSLQICDVEGLSSRHFITNSMLARKQFFFVNFTLCITLDNHFIALFSVGCCQEKQTLHESHVYQLLHSLEITAQQVSTSFFLVLPSNNQGE